MKSIVFIMDMIGILGLYYIKQKSEVKNFTKDKLVTRFLLFMLFSLALGLGQSELDRSLPRVSAQRGWRHRWPEGRRLRAPKHLLFQMFIIQRSWLNYKYTFALFMKKVCVSQIIKEN